MCHLSCHSKHFHVKALLCNLPSRVQGRSRGCEMRWKASCSHMLPDEGLDVTNFSRAHGALHRCSHIRALREPERLSFDAKHRCLAFRDPQRCMS